MTGRYRAASVGAAVPRGGFEGSVHSVFHRALNLRVSREIGLVTLLLSEEADLPQGIRLDAPGRSIFEGLSVGASAACKDGLLTVGESLAVDMRLASVWKCDLSSLAVDLTNPVVVTAWGHAWHVLQASETFCGHVLIGAESVHQKPTLQSALAQHLGAALRSILTATINYDIDGTAALDALVGAGTGLTPSGDDLLTGYLAGLWCTSWRLPERRAFLLALAERVNQHSARTNEIARTYLLLAARGQVSRRLVDLADAIGKGAEAGSVVPTAQAAMRVGHSSGMETVNGLLLGLAAWDRPDLLLL